MSANHNQPTPSFPSLFAADPLAEPLWPRWIGEARYPALRGHLEVMGRHAGLAEPLSARADREPPRLISHELGGERASRIEYHPDYRRLEELSYGAGIVAIKYEAGLLGEDRAVRHLVGFAGGYYFAQTESGMFCPICMTDGVGWVLERHGGAAPAAKEALERVASRDLSRLWRGAMFLTERAGGSDVGSNSVEAIPGGEGWRLRGHKWFCSNVDAEAALVLARMPEGGAGTRGLGLFLLLRDRPGENHRRIRIERLKEKLGTRSMATGEVILEDAAATLIAGAGEGFKAMAEMINLSRTYNAVASVAVGRRAILEALAYGEERRAFGRRLRELPLWRATMADLMAEQIGAFCGVFALVRALDRSECGDPAAARLVRILTPMAKACTAKQAVWSVSEAMEAVGGNGYVEWSPLPRLLRDAQVLPIWEGTTNILSLDLLRAISRERADEALFAAISAALAAAPKDAGAIVSAIEGTLAGLSEALRATAAMPEEVQQRASRGLCERLWRVFCAATLVAEAGGAAEVAAPLLAAARRLLARPFTTAPAGAITPTRALIDDEEALLAAGLAR
ncbi:MAG: acyl-CoA dehydrogenase family protein [Nannocystis sp.]|nr:acyl-CoA dehydrogenase family protein [Nannocystis sp.]